jgi:hypothetical protein
MKGMQTDPMPAPSAGPQQRQWSCGITLIIQATPSSTGWPRCCRYERKPAIEVVDLTMRYEQMVIMKT